MYKMNIEDIPPAIPQAIEIMKKTFGSMDIEIISNVYRLKPSEDAPAGALGCDITVKIPNWEMTPIKLFFRNSLAEDIAYNPYYGHLVAEEYVFDIIRPEYEKMKANLKP